jgi:hypothetical protein
MIRDLQATQDASAANDLAAMRTACASLQAHIAEMRAYPPIPDAESQTHFAVSMELDDQGALDCVAAVITGDSTLLVQATNEFGSAAREKRLLTARVNQFNN